VHAPACRILAGKGYELRGQLFDLPIEMEELAAQALEQRAHSRKERLSLVGYEYRQHALKGGTPDPDRYA
jgi:hypothetical protein